MLIVVTTGTDDRMAAQRPNVQTGAAVVAADHERMGYVSEVRDNDFLVSSDPASGLYVPFDAIGAVRDDQVALNLTREDAELQNWPRLAGEGTTGGMPPQPGPAGSGMPSGGPGRPTFMGTVGVDEPAAGASNLVSSKEAGARGTPQLNSPGGEPREPEENEDTSPFG